MKVKSIIVLLLATALLFTAACGSTSGTSAQQPQEPVQQTQEQPQEQTVEAAATSANNQTGALDIGSGSTVFSFEATDDEGNVSTWNVHTNETTVGPALVAVGLIDGDVSDFGLMVMYVNGIRADFVEDEAWWALYIDDEMAMAGVNDIDIENGVTYKFIYTPA